MSVVEPLDTDVAIEAPEHIIFRHRVAGPSRRFFAYLLDAVICYGTLIVVSVIVLIAVGGLTDVSEKMSGVASAGIGIILVLAFCAEWVYFVAWEAVLGRSPGKIAAGLRVVTVDGRPIGFRESALRNVLRAADQLPIAYLVGVGSMLVTKRFQRLGDQVAGTMVVVADRRDARATPIELRPPASAEERAAFPGVVRLDVEERAAIELFLRRKHALGSAREKELARMLVEPLGRRYDFSKRDPSRVLALLYDFATNAGRDDAPPSSRRPSSKRSAAWR